MTWRLGRAILAGAMLWLGLMAAHALMPWLQRHLGILAGAGTSAAVVALAGWLLRLRRGGRTVWQVLAARRAAARHRMRAPQQVQVSAPSGAALLAVATWPAAILTLVATVGPGAAGVRLPPAWDAWCQLVVIGVVAVAIAAGAGWWLGAGVAARTLAADGFTLASAGCSLLLSALPALLILGRVESRVLWLTLQAAQFAWILGGALAGAAVAGRRKRRLAGLALAGQAASRDVP